MKCTINKCLLFGTAFGLFAWLILIYTKIPTEGVFLTLYTVLSYLTLTPIANFIASALGENGIVFSMFLALVISIIAFTIYALIICKLTNRIRRH